jgi:hypothetical protein
MTLDSPFRPPHFTHHGPNLTRQTAIAATRALVHQFNFKPAVLSIEAETQQPPQLQIDRYANCFGPFFILDHHREAPPALVSSKFAGDHCRVALGPFRPREAPANFVLECPLPVPHVKVVPLHGLGISGELQPDLFGEPETIIFIWFGRHMLNAPGGARSAGRLLNAPRSPELPRHKNKYPKNVGVGSEGDR